MRLVSYRGGFGRLEEGQVVPLGRDILEFLRDGQSHEGEALPLNSVHLAAPVPQPGKIVAIGFNYRDHAAETGTPMPSEPTLFPKYGNSVIGDGDVIRVPRLTAEPDWEAELGVVIGRTAKRIKSDEALEHVAGYMCINDVSARDLQRATTQWTRGKTIDTFMPCGPWLVTPDEVPDPQSLQIQCFVNGHVKQDSSTSQMYWGVADLISFLSQTMTLYPGDVISTGTPPGVGVGRKPQEWLQDGDEVEVVVEGLGRLRNRVVFE